MSRIADFEFNTSPLSAGVILVSQSIRRDFPVAEVGRKLQQLVDEARTAMPDAPNQEQQLYAHLLSFSLLPGVSATLVVFISCPMPSSWIRYWKNVGVPRYH